MSTTLVQPLFISAWIYYQNDSWASNNLITHNNIFTSQNQLCNYSVWISCRSAWQSPCYFFEPYPTFILNHSISLKQIERRASTACPFSINQINFSLHLKYTVFFQFITAIVIFNFHINLAQCSFNSLFQNNYSIRAIRSSH